MGIKSCETCKYCEVKSGEIADCKLGMKREGRESFCKRYSIVWWNPLLLLFRKITPDTH